LEYPKEGLPKSTVTHKPALVTPKVAKKVTKFSVGSVSSAKANQNQGGFNLDKLAKAVAMHETGDCTAKRGAALVKNCHGFRVNGHFLKFNDKSESYAKFEKLWLRDYQEFPDLRLATAWVCGWQHLKKNGTVPCAGGNPKAWLVSVTEFYKSL
jgi:hypothetical protein